MSKIIQQKIFSWKNVEKSREIERLMMVIETMPDEELMKDLVSVRKGRRDDFPIRAVWNSILAGIVYEHISIESLRRELMRNGESADLTLRLKRKQCRPKTHTPRCFRNSWISRKR